MKRYRIDVRISAAIGDLEVEIDEDAPEFRRALTAAANKIIEERLVLLDIKGGRSGDGGWLKVSSVTGIINWDQLS